MSDTMGMADNTDIREQNLTVREVADELAASRQMVHTLIDRGAFPRAFRVGSSPRIPRSDVDAYIAANTVKPKEAQP